MRCRSDVRLWHVCPFTFHMSPFCDVAQTSDCGMFVFYFSVISPLCGVALTPDCGIVFPAFSSRGVIQTLVWHRHYYCSIVNLFVTFRGIILDTRSVHFFYFRIARPYFLCTRASQISFLLHGRLIIINVSEYDYLLLYYTRVLNVCEYIQTYSLACPWLLSWPDFRAWR